jgi:hypothetical protein
MPFPKDCKVCKQTFYVKPSHYKKKVYCSRFCLSKDYKKIMKGHKNPNYRNAGKKECINCHKIYYSYDKGRKYCDKYCYHDDPKTRKELLKKLKKAILSIKNRPKKIKIKKYYYKKKDKIIRAKHICPKPNNKCLKCNKLFHSYNKKSKYCSYRCHLDDGGAKRAGMEAARMAKIKYGHKKDANHNEIVNCLLKLGIPFYDLSHIGAGVPDGIVWIKDRWQLIEIKNLKTSYGRRGLNKNQKEWISKYKSGVVYIIHNIEEAIELSKGKFDKLKCFSHFNL